MDWNKYFTYSDGKLYHKPRVNNKPFNARFAGKEAGTQYDRYTLVNLDGKQYGKHRVVWEMHNTVIPKGMEIHHINSNGNDNHLENLALVTPSQNVQKTSVYFKGYRQKKNGSYEASRSINNKVIYNKCFGTPCGAYMGHRTALI